MVVTPNAEMIIVDATKGVLHYCFKEVIAFLETCN